MHTIQDIYDHYQIMPSLQLHQLRVTAVVKRILDGGNWSEQEKHDALITCLLHDMGNIIKFDLGRFPDLLEPEGEQYWRSVQNSYFDRYGYEEHEATLAIAREIGVNDRPYELLGRIGFSQGIMHAQWNDDVAMICGYSDLRVKPRTVTTLRDRFDDLIERYAVKGKNFDRPQIIEAWFEIEKDIQRLTSLSLDSITEEGIEGLLIPLRNYDILAIK